jgi:hypothetical protein
VSLTEPGRAGHVHLGQVAVDDVDPHEPEAVGPQRGSQCVDDPPVTRVEGDHVDRAAQSDIGPEVPPGRPAAEHAQGPAVEQEDSPVPVEHACEEPLRHHRAQSTPGPVGHQSRPVGVVRSQEADPVPTVAVQWLEHRAMVFVGEPEQGRLVGGHHCLGHQVREPAGVELLVGLAQGARIVDDQRPPAGELEEEGHGQVVGSHRGVGAHQHGVDLGQVDRIEHLVGEPDPPTGGDGAGPRRHPSVDQ